ncbi:zinc finger protein 235-like [Argiope bruennichi]|uniref:zinc finger protein 235-like n=1 Tax=Argiope bruennichi TaxID=94029 RepID=UPI00249416C0|nr:zinc finger protein 235-like [Argiope bruennichi]
MAELRCINCNEAFEREQGHRCLNSPWMLGTENANTILEDNENELNLDENEVISSVSVQLPKLSKVCTEIFNRNSDSDTDASLSKEVIFGTDQHKNSNPLSFSEKSETCDKRSVSDIHAIPGPSRLPLNESEGSFCKEEFQFKPTEVNPTDPVPTEVKLRTCKICHKVFTKKYHLKRHMQIHEGVKNLTCDFCEKSFHRKNNLQTHVKTHTGEKPFPCDVCGMRFITHYRLQRHRTVDGRKMVRDISDGLAFEGREYVSLASEQLPGLSAVSTEIFNRNPDSYTASSLLKQDTLRIDKHTRSSYVIVSEKSEDYEKCLVSDIQAVPSSSQLQVSKDKGRLCQEYLQPKPYRAVPTNVKIVICNICQKVLKRNYLKKHMLTHGGKKTHRCDLCGKSFLLKSNLLKHTRGHTSDKPFSCDVCGKRFETNDDLKSHINPWGRETIQM